MVKSIIDVDINDEKFKEFSELFERYQGLLAKTPSAWANVNKETKAAQGAFVHIASALMAQNALERKLGDAERGRAKVLRDEEMRWNRMVRGSREFASNVSGITKNILQWTKVGAIGAGLLGFGGFFGLNRLAGDVSASRRAALGVNASYGQRRAFELDYGRVVEPTSFLGGVQEALQDVTKRQTLYGAGLTERDLAGKNTAQVADELIRKLKAIADATPPQFLAQVMEARGLGQFASLQDLQRLRGTPMQEILGYGKAYQRDSVSLGLSPQNQRTWQDFSVQMSRASARIENVFVKGLGKLVRPLDHLSESVVNALDAFLSSKKLGEWIEDAGKGIEWFANYVGSPDFRNSIIGFGKDVGDMVSGMAGFVRWVRGLTETTPAQPASPGHPARPAVPGYDIHHGVGNFAGSVKQRAYANGLTNLGPPSSWPGGILNWLDTSVHHWKDNLTAEQRAMFGNNVGNLRPYGASSGFRTFPTKEAGIQALAKDLLYKERVRKLDTIEKIISRYTDPKVDNQEAYIKDVASTSGYGRAQHLNLEDTHVLASIISAISKHEKGAKNQVPVEVILRVVQDPGSNLNISASQVAKQ